MRDRITRELITKKGFRFVAIEGDWPDAARVDHYVRHLEYPPSEWTAFARFPAWMWRNNEVRAFVDWLREHNAPLKPRARVGVSWARSVQPVRFDPRGPEISRSRSIPATAQVARERYGCLTPWQSDPATYGHAALTGAYPTCESDVAIVLTDLLHKRREYAERDGERFMDAVQNARLDRQCRALLSHHVLRLARILESARQPHVRDVEDAARLLWPEQQGHRLGSQLAHRQCRGDRDVFPRRVQSRPSLPEGIRRLVPMPSASAPTAARSRRRRTGTARWRSRRSCPRSPRATSDICHETGKPSLPAGSAPIRAQRDAEACASHGWSARSA